ncbi:MAG: SPOR domain-containing protein [Pseudomonadota bacterium]
MGDGAGASPAQPTFGATRPVTVQAPANAASRRTATSRPVGASSRNAGPANPPRNQARPATPTRTAGLNPRVNVGRITRVGGPVSNAAARPSAAQPATGVSVSTVINPVTGRRNRLLPPDRKGAVPAAALARSAVSDVRSTRVAAARRAPPSTTAAVTSSGTASSVGAQRLSPGYVVVLASVPKSATSRIEALKRFADIQQTYGSVLTGKSPDVREANLGARGSYHRLMVGPPGSRDGANQLCSRLKSSGYSGCWVTAY